MKTRKIARMMIVLVVILASMSIVVQPGGAQIDIPPGAVIESATFSIYTPRVSYQTVYLHRIMADWSEMGVTWNNFGGRFDPAMIGSFVADGYGWHSVDVTALVQAWVSGDYPNYGLLLEQGTSVYTTYHSSESSLLEQRPKLEICYMLANSGSTCVTIQRPGTDQDGVADAYIWQYLPDYNGGNSSTLYTGLVGDGEKQTLIRFDLPLMPSDEGCTRTQGYWKTHSKYGPAPYDATWDFKDEGDAEFLETGESYYKVLWTNPKGGNAYIILAHQYIAAELNLLSGAYMPPDVSETWNEAGELLIKYQNDPSIPKKNPDRRLAIQLARLLDDYNNGLLGPRHCTD